jgi:integrase
MGRPRTKQTGLPSYCYRKPGGSYYMKKPGPGGGLVNAAYGRDLDRMLADWRATWGAPALGERPRLMDGLFDAFIVKLAQRLLADELSKTTVDDYHRCIGGPHGLRAVWGRVRILDVDPPALAAWQEERGKQSRRRCNLERTVLSECFKQAILLGSAKANPVDHLKPLKEKPRTRYVTDAEFSAVFALAPPIVRAAMVLAAITGLRQGDILRLRRSDFDPVHGLTVQTRKTGQPLEFEWTEGLRHAVLLAVGARDFIPLVLLATDEGKPYTSTGFRTAWYRAMVAAQDASRPSPDAPPRLKRFTFNDLRAKAGSESRDWKLLGHLDQRTFERVYNRLPRQVRPTR